MLKKLKSGIYFVGDQAELDQLDGYTEQTLHVIIDSFKDRRYGSPTEELFKKTLPMVGGVMTLNHVDKEELDYNRITLGQYDRDGEFLEPLTMGSGSNILVYKEALYEMSDQEELAIMLHEVYHAKERHLSANLLPIDTPPEYYIERELAADAFSVAVVGKKTFLEAYWKFVKNRCRLIAVHIPGTEYHSAFKQSIVRDLHKLRVKALK